ncbi:heme lyase CcmF/NrfE family subunit [candidate division KSB1 bacterium]
MGVIGNFSLIVAFGLSLYTIGTSVVGARQRRNDLVLSAERSLLASAALIVVASFSLINLLVRSDFSNIYVTSYTNVDLPLFYKFAAFWAGQSGSLMFWLLIISVISTIAVIQNRKQNRVLMPYVISTMSFVMAFFIFVSLFLSNPFDNWIAETQVGLVSYVAPDGNGLNPLLQHWAMVIHPPVLFWGYSGFLVPFGFAIASLVTGKLDTTWIKTTRRWTIISWMILSTGILLGGKWAYVELGWGGYWAWDPVENASLMPWLTATAYLHSVMVQEKRGMLKVWNMSLILSTFLLCIFGTFLTRSGIVSSVHAFASSTIGPAFAVFLILLTGASIVLLLKRLPELKSEAKLDSLISRESGFLFNNLILVGAMLATLWGTIFPVLSEWVRGTQITVGAAYFNQVNIPIGLFLLFLTGIGPLFAWRRSSVYSLKKNFLYPMSLSIIFGVLLFFLGVKHPFALISFFLCFFVAVTVFQEFLKGTLVRMKNLGESFFRALINLMFRNTRRYGGYIVHFGMVFMFIGFTGNSFNKELKTEVKDGESFHLGGYEIRLDKTDTGLTNLYRFEQADITVLKDGKEVSKEVAQRRVYLASNQPTTEVAIFVTFFSDLYLVYSEPPVGDRGAEIIAYINPLISFVWLGGGVLILGSLIAVIPNIIPKRDMSKYNELSKKESVVEA